MPKRIYVTVRDYNARTGEASLVEPGGRIFRVQLNQVTSTVNLQNGLRVAAMIDDNEQAVMQIERG